MELFTHKNENLLEKSKVLKSGLGAVAWATLEMLVRGGMPTEKVAVLHGEMKKYFSVPSNEECNAILRVVEKRLLEEKKDAGTWY